MDASGYFPTDAGYDDDTLNLLTSWEKLLLTKRPIIAPDGYIPNSVVRRRLRFVQPELSKSEWKLKPAPDFDPRYLPEGWKMKPNVSKNSSTVPVNVVSVSDVKGKLPHNEAFRFRDDLVVVPMKNPHKNGTSKFDYQTGLRKHNKVEFSLGSNLESDVTNTESRYENLKSNNETIGENLRYNNMHRDENLVLNNLPIDDNLGSNNVLEPGEKDEDGKENAPEHTGNTINTHISNQEPGFLSSTVKQNVSKHRPEPRPDSMKSTNSSRKKRKSERKKKLEVRQSLELGIVEPSNSAGTDDDVKSATNERMDIVQRLLQENWFPLKDQHDMIVIMEELVKLLECNEDEIFTAVCQYLVQIYQLFSIAHEIRVKTLDKLVSQLKSQSAVISERSKWTLQQLESLTGHIPADMACEKAENKNVVSEVQTDISGETHCSDESGNGMAESQTTELQPDIKTPRSRNSRNSNRSKLSAKSNFTVKSKRIKSRKDKSKRSKADTPAYEKITGRKSDEVVANSEEIHRTIDKTVNDKNSSSTYQLIDDIRNGMKYETMRFDQDDSKVGIQINTHQLTDVIKENASYSKPEEYLLKLPRMSETRMSQSDVRITQSEARMSQSEEPYTDMLKINSITDTTGSIKNGVTGSHLIGKAAIDDDEMVDKFTYVGDIRSSNDSRDSVTFISSDAISIRSSIDSDRDSSAQIKKIRNPDGNIIFHDISSEAAIVGSHIAVDLNAQSLSSTISKSTHKTTQEAYQNTHYENKKEEIKAIDHLFQSKKDASFPSVTSVYPVQYAVIGAPAPQYNLLKKKTDNAVEINTEDDCCNIPETCPATSQNNMWSLSQYMEACMPFKNEQNIEDNGKGFKDLLSPKISLPALPSQDTSMKKELLLAFCDGLPNINKRTLKMSSLHIRDESVESFTRHTTSFQQHRGHLHCEHMKCAQNKMHKYISISKYLSNMSLSQRMSDLSSKFNERSTFGNSRNSRSVDGLQNY